MIQRAHGLPSGRGEAEAHAASRPEAVGYSSPGAVNVARQSCGPPRDRAIIVEVAPSVHFPKNFCVSCHVAGRSGWPCRLRREPCGASQRGRRKRTDGHFLGGLLTVKLGTFSLTKITDDCQRMCLGMADHWR